MVYLCANVGPQSLLVVRLPVPFVPHSSSLSPTTAMGVLSARVPVSAPPTGHDECLFFISLVSDFLAVRFSVSSGCARRRSVSTYAAAAILVLPTPFLLMWCHITLAFFSRHTTPLTHSLLNSFIHTYAILKPNLPYPTLMQFTCGSVFLLE